MKLDEAIAQSPLGIAVINRYEYPGISRFYATNERAWKDDYRGIHGIILDELTASLDDWHPMHYVQNQSDQTVVTQAANDMKPAPATSFLEKYRLAGQYSAQLTQMIHDMDGEDYDDKMVKNLQQVIKVSQELYDLITT